ncbi:MAG: hypothetical protein AMJ63_10030 [Myxococcales bacterium SG8_38_1]|nr:MAG: hypothetical protein AMJ63_10030 [Myxococcales bacterium SG8_38_1]
MRAGQQLEVVSATFGLAASAVLHFAAFAYIASAAAQFDFDFAITLPAEVEFGIAEGMELAGAPTQASSSAGGVVEAGPKAAPSDAVIIDAGVAETDTRADAGANTDADTDADADMAADTDADAVSTLDGPSRLPPGAHLALRIDMKRVRESPLGPDVTHFLRGVPDWQLILDGSGIDPVADLDRLLVATPNLERSKLVLAGKHRRDATFARGSVKRLARARGKSVRWKSRYGVPTAPWLNQDQTPRTIALLSPHHFSITRRQDLQRVLALAKAREDRDAHQEGLLAAHGPDALLSMGLGEALALEVEGVHRFVIGSIKNVPARLRVAVRETGPDEATVSVLATYPTPLAAREAPI